MSKFNMHIFIDGYNLIRQSADLKRFERHSLEAGRKALIDWLADYRRRKGHDITVVFDGWKEGSPLEERDYAAGIRIIYSPRQVKADDILKRIAATSDEDIMIVSSDREIASFAERKGRTVFSSMEFEEIVNRSAFPGHGDAPEEKDDEGDSRHFRKKGPAHKLSRAERHKQTKIRKL